MSEFDYKSLGEIAKCRMGETILSKDLDGCGYPIFSADSSAGEWGRKSHISKVLMRGSIVIGARGTIGNPRLPDHDKFGCTQTTIAVIPNDELDPYYLKLALEFSDLKSIAAQQAVPMLTISEISQLELPIPPLPEQKKIAEILSGIDKQVLDLKIKASRTNSSKKSVFADFLAGENCETRRLGVGEWSTGVIDQAQCIPVSWEIVNINTVAQLESGHTPSRKCPEYWGGAVPWISLADTKQLELEHAIHETSENTNALGISNSSARLLPEGTVCLSRTASVGKSVIMGREMATSQDFANFICGPRLDPYFLMFLFRYMQGTWKALSGGSTHQTIYMPIFKALQIPLPSIEEQRHIAAVMIGFDNAESSLNKKIQKIFSLKHALSADLLSGRKRVSV